ncbi:MAG: membrane trafficking protein [Clostridia bacterium]|nr:membrane trafficking protein [Clostridia bacterium]
MSESLNKKIAEMLGKMDEKVMQAKLNAALDMLKKGNTDELAKKINKVDKDELLKKVDELDESKLKELNINKSEIQKKVSNADLEKLSQLIGENGDEIVKKIKAFLNT